MGNIGELIAGGKAILGIEFGSTRIKAVLIDEAHKPIVSGDHVWENRLENGFWTYHDDEIWAGLQDAYANLKKDVADKYDVKLTKVAALGFSAMMHGYLAFDKDGNLLPDEVRLTPFGEKLRSTSLDELPELLNILKGDMSLVGPRPLLVQYLPLYNKRQHRRHDVRPGITGLAQINGRNSISWEEKFEYDVQYVENLSFKGDIKILFDTVFKVLKKEGINSENSATMEDFMGTPEKED